MIHTIQLRAFMSHETYTNIITNKAYPLIKGKNCYFTNTYSYMGINKVEFKKFKNDRANFTCYYANININLNLIINYEYGFTEKEEFFYRNTPIQANILHDQVIFAIYQKIFDIFPMFNRYKLSLANIVKHSGKEKATHLHNWQKENYSAFSLSQIDYTYDINLPYVDTYLKLINMGHNPYSEKRKSYEHEVGEDNIYIRNYSIKINCYNKQRELFERFKDSDKASAHNVFRVEVGFFKAKLNAKKYDKKAMDIDDRVLFDFVNIDFSHDEVIKYIKKLTFSGHYFDYKTACRIIDDTTLYSNNIKTKLKNLLRNIKEYKGYDHYLNYAKKQGFKEATIKSYIKKLEALDINPVTLSKRERNAYHLDGGIYFLPSILTMIDKMYEIEKDNSIHPENVIDSMNLSKS